MPATTAKEAARELIEKLPDDATWEEIQYQIYFRQKVEAGLKDLREGRVVSHEEVMREFGVTPQ